VSETSRTLCQWQLYFILIIRAHTPVFKDYNLLGRSMALKVSRRVFTAQSRIQTQPSPFETCGEQRGTGNLFEDFGFPPPPCQDQFMNAPYSLIHPLPTLCNLSNRVLEKYTKNYVLEYDTAYFGRQTTFIAARTSRFIKVIHSMHRKRWIKKDVRMFFRHFWPVLIILSDAFSHSKYITSIVWWLVNQVWEKRLCSP
jgi:hypothetical protein